MPTTLSSPRVTLPSRSNSWTNRPLFRPKYFEAFASISAAASLNLFPSGALEHRHLEHLTVEFRLGDLLQDPVSARGAVGTAGRGPALGSRLLGGLERSGRRGGAIHCTIEGCAVGLVGRVIERQGLAP